MSIYTYSERTQKNYTFQDAINNAHNRLIVKDSLLKSRLVKSRDPKEPVTLEQVNFFADQIVRGF